MNGSTLEASNRFNVFVAPGYEVDKDKPVYLKAGYSSVSAKSNSPTSYSIPGESRSLSSTNQSKTFGGYVLGLGYKQFITGGLYGLAEFNYMSYSKSSFSSTDSMGYTTTTNPSASAYQVLVGLGYKF